MAIRNGPVLVLGAGATKACKGPLTNEILFEADKVSENFERKDYVDLVDSCLKDVFRLPEKIRRKTSTLYPGLPLLMSLIDTAIDRGQPLWNYDAAKLRNVRAAIEYIIFAVLEHNLRSVPMFHRQAIDKLFPGRAEPRIISLNYDIIIDNTLAVRSEQLPDYGCDIQTEAYRNGRKFGKLLKLHGSLNWLYCPNCHYLDVAFSESGRTFSKALQMLFPPQALEEKYKTGGKCPNCETDMRSVMITPTQKKDYRNPHIAQVWYRAEEMLRSADSVVFIGYSMPTDDVEVVYLLKRGLANLPAEKITVVEFDTQNRSVDRHEVGQRYQSIFGPGIQWHTCGFEGWLAQWSRPSKPARPTSPKKHRRSRSKTSAANSRKRLRSGD
jgi:hypothetical protein